MPDLLQGAQTLQDLADAYPEKNRVFGGRAHEDTLKYICDELDSTGFYDVYRQKQTHKSPEISPNVTVNGAVIEVGSMRYSPSGTVNASLTLVSNKGCQASDYPPQTTGTIAVIPRGRCSFREKVLLATSSGAAAAIIYNDASNALSGTLGVPSSSYHYIPTVGISERSGKELVDLLRGDSSIAAQLEVNVRWQNRTTYNIVAQTKRGDPNNIVAVGAHTDSVNAGTGLDDNGSGTIGILNVAKALNRSHVHNTVRFLFWTAEEVGLLGSSFYLDHLNTSELAKIRMYLNFDMIASPNYGLFTHDGDGSTFGQPGPPGSGQIEWTFQQFFDLHRIPLRPIPFSGRSDYAPFMRAGIPVGGLETGAEGMKSEEEAMLFGGQAGIPYDVNYHAAADSMSNLNPTAFLINTRAAAFTVATYARSLESIPTRVIRAVERHQAMVEYVDTGLGLAQE